MEHFLHTTSAECCLAQAAIRFCLIPPARGLDRSLDTNGIYDRSKLAARRSEIPPVWTLDTSRTGRQGEHKSQFYNILGMMGQTQCMDWGARQKSSTGLVVKTLESILGALRALG